jgi:hypothetical protein
MTSMAKKTPRWAALKTAAIPPATPAHPTACHIGRDFDQPADLLPVTEPISAMGPSGPTIAWATWTSESSEGHGHAQFEVDLPEATARRMAGKVVVPSNRPRRNGQAADQPAQDGHGERLRRRATTDRQAGGCDVGKEGLALDGRQAEEDVTPTGQALR